MFMVTDVAHPQVAGVADCVLLCNKTITELICTGYMSCTVLYEALGPQSV